MNSTLLVAVEDLVAGIARDPELQRSSSFPEVLMERRYSTSHRNITPDNRPSSTRE
jgi:hypothetical protein